jgi:hypothetical protein
MPIKAMLTDWYTLLQTAVLKPRMRSKLGKFWFQSDDISPTWCSAFDHHGQVLQSKF